MASRIDAKRDAGASLDSWASYNISANQCSGAAPVAARTSPATKILAVMPKPNCPSPPSGEPPDRGLVRRRATADRGERKRCQQMQCTLAEAGEVGNDAVDRLEFNDCAKRQCHPDAAGPMPRALVPAEELSRSGQRHGPCRLNAASSVPERPQWPAPTPMPIVGPAIGCGELAADAPSGG